MDFSGSISGAFPSWRAGSQSSLWRISSGAWRETPVGWDWRYSASGYQWWPAEKEEVVWRPRRLEVMSLSFKYQALSLSPFSYPENIFVPLSVGAHSLDANEAILTNVDKDDEGDKEGNFCNQQNFFNKKLLLGLEKCIAL